MRISRNICKNIFNTIPELLFFQFEKSDHIYKNTFREIIYYLIFLTFATLVVVSNTSNYWFTSIVRVQFIYDKFKTMYPDETDIYTLRNLEEVWIAMNNILFESIYWSYWYKHDKITRKEKLELYLIGVPRIRQLRVKKTKCTNKKISTLHEYCYDPITTVNMDREPFGLKNGTAWTFHTLSELNSMWSFTGKLQSYDGGGYYQELTLNKLRNEQILKNLKQNLWITRQTRAVFIDFTVYNGNVNVFLIVKILFEIPATGGVIVTRNIDNVKILTIVNKYDFFILGCLLICYGFLIYFMTLMVKSIKRYKMKYFYSAWNKLEVVLVTLGFIYLIICIYGNILTYIAIREVNKKPGTFVSFEKVGNCYGHVDNVMAILILLLYLKLFKYIELNKTLGQLNATIQIAMLDLTGFLIVFFIIFISYAQFGYLLFGSQLESFSTVMNSVFTLLKTVNGEFNYDEIEESGIYLGPIYFVSFIFLVFFVLLNMFLAIICDAYTIIKNEINFGEDYDIMNFLKRGGRNLFRKYPKVAKLFEASEEQAKMHNLRKVLKMAKYSDIEIDLLLSHYYFSDDKDISVEEINEFVTDVRLHNYQMYEAADFIRNKKDTFSYISEQDLENQQKQIEALERNCAKLSRLIDKLHEKKNK